MPDTGLMFYSSASRFKIKPNSEVFLISDKYGFTFGGSSFICTALVIMFGTDLPSSIFKVVHNY